MMGSKGQVASADALRVFISSRMDELAGERSVLHTALSKAGCAPWLFEVDAGARPGSARNTYLEILDTCDVYLGLFWKTRGDYTVDEFDAARRSGLACLIYEKQAVGREAELESFLEEIGHVEEGVTIRRFCDADELSKLVIADIEAIQGELLRVRGPAGRTYTASHWGGRFDRTAAATPIRRHPLHETDGPRPPDPFVDRLDPVDRLQQALRGGERMLGVSGEPGIGKSAVLRYLAHHPGLGIEQYPDGVGIYLEGGRWPRAGDLLRALWAELFRVGEHGYVPDDVELRADLGAKKALVFVDEVRLTPDEAERVHAHMPDSSLVMAAPGDLGSLAYAKSIPLQGFDDPEDIVELFSACCGQSVPSDSVDQVVEVCRRAGAGPGAITRLACDAWGSGLPVSEWLASRVEPDSVMALLERALDEEGRRLLTILASFGPDVATPIEVVDRLGVSHRKVRELVSAGHAYENSPDLRLAGAEYRAICSGAEVGDLRNRVFDTTVQWVAEAHPDRIRQARPFLLEMLEWGAGRRRHREVMTLAQALAPQLAVAGAWDSWGAAVTHARIAAQVLGDRSGRAWALHEEGTRQMMLGNDRQARRLLRSARKLRANLGERGAVAVTTHNLSHLPSIMPVGRLVWTMLAVVAVAVAVVLGVMAVTGREEVEPPESPPVVTTMVRPEPAGTPAPVAPRPENQAPIARDDEFEVEPGGTVRLDLFGNDSDPDGDEFGLADLEQPLHGHVYAEEDGHWYYENWDSDVETDSFTYIIRDGEGATDGATVTILIIGRDETVNRPPVARDDSFEVELDGRVWLDLLANDSDPDDHVLRIVDVDQPEYGAVVQDEDEQWYYDAWQYDPITESFSYTIADVTGATATAVVTVTVVPPPAPDNLAPRADAITITAGCGPEPVVLTGSDPEGAELVFSIIDYPRLGTLTDPPDFPVPAVEVVYTPEVGEGSYDDSFTFEVSDGEAVDRATVTIAGICIR